MTTAPANSRRAVTSGWLSFAGILVLVIGLFNAMDGLVAPFKDDYYLVTSGKVLVFNFTTCPAAVTSG